MPDLEFVYTTYINTTPERLWRALTEPAFTRQYWAGVAMESDWRPGSSVRLSYGPEQAFEDLDQVVLESEPYRLLSYTWHRYQAEDAAKYGWTDEQMAAVLSQQASTVTFRIEDDGGVGVRAVRLSVVHGGFADGSLVYRSVSGQAQGGGWPELLANLKTYLELGVPLPAKASRATLPGHAETRSVNA